MADVQTLAEIARLIRHLALKASTQAGSGHPSSSLSATELMTALFFGRGKAVGPFFRYDAADPAHPNNDRLIFSKGHASPLFYGLWAAAGAVEVEELDTYRKFGSRLEGHPTRAFPYTEAATGSLGQGLAIGVGMAVNAKLLDRLPYRTFVLLGDSEMAEGSQWEALQLAAHYALNNLVAVLDVNRLGQRGPTMYGHDLGAYERRVAAFGWRTYVVDDGHDLEQLCAAYDAALSAPGSACAPAMIIARTLKGRGAAAMEDKDGWHGKPLPRDMLAAALAEVGPVNLRQRGELARPANLASQRPAAKPAPRLEYDPAKPVATRLAYGNALKRLAEAHPRMVVLDAEVSNSTYADVFKKAHPERFLEMFIAEQHMLGAALGLSLRGHKPCVSTFAAFLSRAYDQIRMSRYSDADMLVSGSHAGVSIGEDGVSQMALEDLAFFRTILDAAVLYPSDAVSCERLVEEALARKGISYIRTTRMATPILYSAHEQFPIGGSKTLRESPMDAATVLAAGVTLHEALAAAEKLAAEGVKVRVVDLYSVKPLDAETITRAARETRRIVTVEDHYAEGGLGEAVAGVLAQAGAAASQTLLAVRRMPRSGTPDELLAYEDISRLAIIKAVKEAL